MKRAIAVLLLAALLAGCAAAVYEGPTREAYMLTEVVTEHISEVTGNGWSARQILRYDSFGNPVRRETLRDGQRTELVNMKYDERGNLISRITWDYEKWIPYIWNWISYSYDAQDRLIKTTYRNFLGLPTGEDTYVYDDEANSVTWNGTMDTQTTWYNENGDPVRRETFSHPAGITITSSFTYDELGREISSTSAMDGAPSMESETTYDDQGRLARVTTWDADGRILADNTYQYGENTMTVTREDGDYVVTYYHSDGRVERTEHYDEQGNLGVIQSSSYQLIRIPADGKE